MLENLQVLPRVIIHQYFKIQPKLSAVILLSLADVLTEVLCLKNLNCNMMYYFQEALKVMEFSEEEIRDVFKLLSAVLQMGNIEFMTAGGAQITSNGGEEYHRGSNI